MASQRWHAAILEYLNSQYTELDSWTQSIHIATDAEQKRAAAIRKSECYLRIIRIADVVQNKDLADRVRSLLKRHLRTHPDAVEATCSAIAHDSVVVEEDVLSDLVMEALAAGRGNGGGKRSVKTPPGSPDQVNDKTSRTKAGQLNMAYDKCQLVTTPTVSGSKEWPRNYSVIVTFNECKPNQGGGDRTTPTSARDKKLAVPQVVVRATEDDILTDGRMGYAFRHIGSMLLGEKGKKSDVLKGERLVTLKMNKPPPPMKCSVAFSTSEYEDILFKADGKRTGKRTIRDSPRGGVADDEDLEDILDTFSDADLRGLTADGYSSAAAASAPPPGSAQAASAASAQQHAASVPPPGPAQAASAASAQQQPAFTMQQQPVAPAQQQPTVVVQQPPAPQVTLTPSPFGAQTFQMVPQPSPMAPQGLFQQVPRCPNGTLCTMPNCRFAHY